MGLFDKFKAGLQRTKEKLSHEITRIVTGSPKLDEDTLEEIEFTLIGADLGMPMTQRILSAVRDSYESQGKDGLDVLGVARREIAASFTGGVQDLQEQDGLTVVSMVGVNGTGKTTTTAKLANRMHATGKTSVLAACDTFRAAAVEQLQTWGERNGVPVIAQHTGADSASVLFDAISAAKARNVDVLLADTAGRLNNKTHLMEELEKIVRVLKKADPEAPHETLLVLDAGTGQNAVAQAREFDASVGITGIALTKLDGTAKGGVVFAIGQEVKRPIRFIGIGEAVDDLRPFDAEDFVNALFTSVD